MKKVFIMTKILMSAGLKFCTIFMAKKKLVSPARVVFPSKTPMTHQYPIESIP